MRKALSVVTNWFVLLAAAHTALADSTWEFAVQVSAAVQASPAQITLSWPQDTYMLPASYSIFRRSAAEQAWSPIANLPGTTTSYVDNAVAARSGYEYQVVKTTSQYTGYGYVYAGSELPLVESRGKLLLVVDSTYAANLASELERLRQDLVGDGWTVVRLNVNRNDSVTSVKNQIKSQYQADPQQVKAVFLFGHVPVPYSGDIVPDGHVPDHQGAWPCDGYYGDMDGAWTDSSVNSTSANDARNRNVPGDGKFDQSTFPAPLKLMVGRVDLANMPGRLSWGGAPTLPSELELLRNYLNKDHKFRHKQFDLPRRAILGDFFGTRDGEAFAASGWRNYATFFGASNLSNVADKGAWVNTLASTPALCAYGCGAGSYTSIAGLGNTDAYDDVVTTELVSKDIKTAFALLFGSWLGDWDSEDNILRSVLAAPSYGLASAWSGRPHWYTHHMALGQPIGYSARLTQNNGANGGYKNQLNSCAGQIHIALMGDPSLRLHTVAPVTGLVGNATGSSVALNWTASADSVMGYHVYRAANLDSSFTRLTATPLTTTSFVDTAASGSAVYMVRAVKLETSASGSYYNASQGAFYASDATLLAGGSSTGSTTGNTTGNSGSTGSTSGGSGSSAGTPETPATPSTATGGSPSVAGMTNAVVWLDDALPAGVTTGTDGGDDWTWVSSNPAPASGTLAHQSAATTGMHQHYFYTGSGGLTVNAGDSLFTWVYLDSDSVPSQVMLQWSSEGSWEHRAYWGANYVNFGTDGTPGRRYMGGLPAAGQWALLQVPASVVGLEGKTIEGMAFTLYSGRATFDFTGKMQAGGSANPPGGGYVTNTPPVSVTNGAVVKTLWVDEGLPSGAVPGTEGEPSWTWIKSPAPFSGSVAHESPSATGPHQHYFTWANNPLAVNTGDVLFTYVYLDPADSPSEIMVQWNDGSWEHRAYWGANNLSYGVNGTVNRQYMGALPPAGKWVCLQVPAAQVGLEGSSLNGMAFTVYNGHALWDAAGKANGFFTDSTPQNGGGSNETNLPPVVDIPPDTTNSPSGGNGTNTVPGVSLADYVTPQLPPIGATALHVLTPTLLELVLVNTKQQGASLVSAWDLVDANSQFLAPSLNAFRVMANGQQVGIAGVGFKRRALYAPLAGYDLRVGNYLYLQLSAPLTDRQTVQVMNPDGSLWASSTDYSATVDPLRYSPAIHVNQEGYMPGYAKIGKVGYYAGSLGEVPVAASTFTIVNAASGAQVFQGSLVRHQDKGYTYSPTPYQKVYDADFTAFTTPGEYRLVVPGMGASLPFLIDDGIAMSFTRAYALGLYHQRCGTNTALPYTRFTHDRCHTAAAEVPTSSSDFNFTWNTIANYANTPNPNNPPQIAGALTGPAAQLFPMLRQGAIDVSGGHHDAGDYSKYTINSASLIHYLVFAADSLQGVAELDNLGIPESGDGISDVLQEAKWEADFVAKMQDTDGGFYFLVYPKGREYEGNVAPDHGDPQVVWPKTTSVTAASVAALAQCASSPAFKRAYPEAAALYLQKAQLGWQFLMNAIAQYGKNGAYQKITHYGDDFADNDELAWAACQMYLATGDPSVHEKLLAWFDPADPATWRWGWWHMAQCFGHAIRSYAFAVQSGRLTAGQLDANYLNKCKAQIKAAADDVLSFSQQNAYGSSFPLPTKAVQNAGWYFSCDQAFDLVVAQQLAPQAEYIKALLANMAFEGGCNPVNVTYITGLGWKRQRDIVSQWAINDSRQLPPSGIPVGNITGSFGYLWNYQSQLQALSFPSDGAASAPYPFYDRWGDSWNVNAEMVVLNQARGLGAVAFLAAQTSLKRQAWKSVGAQIVVPTKTVPVGTPVTVSLQASGVDLSAARITWEARDQEPVFGPTFSFTPSNNGVQWVEAEAQLPDGRRVFASGSFTVNSPNVVWCDDALPAGATPGADGGDSWNWLSNPAPASGRLVHQSGPGAGSHQQYFTGASTTLSIGSGDVLYAYVYLDPANSPSEIMLQWNDGTWNHRAYWGANTLNYGVEGTAGRVYMGPLPAAGQWVQLKVPAARVALEGRTLSGMAFTAQGGQLFWDAAGRLSPASQNSSGSNVVVNVASTSDASRLENRPGKFTFTRTGDTGAAVTIQYSLQGTARAGVDYQTLPTLTLAAGESSKTLDVVPLATSDPVSSQSIVLKLTSSADYEVGSPGSASITMIGNTVPSSVTGTGSNQRTLVWNTQLNHHYGVAFKDDLRESSWTIATIITGTGGSVRWWDPDTEASSNRFYTIKLMD